MQKLGVASQALARARLSEIAANVYISEKKLGTKLQLGRDDETIDLLCGSVTDCCFCGSLLVLAYLLPEGGTKGFLLFLDARNGSLLAPIPLERHEALDAGEEIHLAADATGVYPDSLLVGYGQRLERRDPSDGRLLQTHTLERRDLICGMFWTSFGVVVVTKSSVEIFDALRLQCLRSIRLFHDTDQDESSQIHVACSKQGDTIFVVRVLLELNGGEKLDFCEVPLERGNPSILWSQRWTNKCDFFTGGRLCLDVSPTEFGHVQERRGLFAVIGCGRQAVMLDVRYEMGRSVTSTYLCRVGDEDFEEAIFDVAAMPYGALVSSGEVAVDSCDPVVSCILLSEEDVQKMKSETTVDYFVDLRKGRLLKNISEPNCEGHMGYGCISRRMYILSDVAEPATFDVWFEGIPVLLSYSCGDIVILRLRESEELAAATHPVPVNYTPEDMFQLVLSGERKRVLSVLDQQRRSSDKGSEVISTDYRMKSSNRVAGIDIGDTLLHAACKRKDSELVRALVQRGAKMTKNSLGKRPDDYLN